MLLLPLSNPCASKVPTRQENAGSVVIAASGWGSWWGLNTFEPEPYLSWEGPQRTHICPGLTPEHSPTESLNSYWCKPEKQQKQWREQRAVNPSHPLSQPPKWEKLCVTGGARIYPRTKEVPWHTPWWKSCPKHPHISPLSHKSSHWWSSGKSWTGDEVGVSNWTGQNSQGLGVFPTCHQVVVT